MLKLGTILTTFLIGIFISSAVSTLVKPVELAIKQASAVSPKAEADNHNKTTSPISEKQDYTYTLPTSDPQGFRVAGVRSDSEAIRFFVKFQDAVASNEKDVVADMMFYPLNVNLPTDTLGRKYRSIQTRRSFIRMYDRIFDNKLRTLIANVDPYNKEDLWGNYHGIAVDRGVIWMGVYCKDNKCEGETFIKIRTIHGNSAFIDQ